MTCHLILILANALSPTNVRAPAGQLARLLAWSSANEKPQETSVHLNPQMGGQRGKEGAEGRSLLGCACVCVGEKGSVRDLAVTPKHY